MTFVRNNRLIDNLPIAKSIEVQYSQHIFDIFDMIYDWTDGEIDVSGKIHMHENWEMLILKENRL